MIDLVAQVQGNGLQNILIDHVHGDRRPSYMYFFLASTVLPMIGDPVVLIGENLSVELFHTYIGVDRTGTGLNILRA
jgi:hypothetical protein